MPASSSASRRSSLDKLRAWKSGVVGQAHQRPRRTGEAAQGAGGAGTSAVRFIRTRCASRRRRARRPSPSTTASSPRVRASRASRAFRTKTSASSIPPARSSCPRFRSGCSSSAAASSGSRWRRCTTRSGSKITVVELMDSLIPGADQDIVRAAREAHREALRENPAQDQGREDRGAEGRPEGHIRRRKRARAAGFRLRPDGGRPPPERPGDQCRRPRA